MKTELILKFPFEASHSLADYEVPHPHIWRLEFGISGAPIEGRIIDIVRLRDRVQKLLHPLTGSYLNENSEVNDEVRHFPTCETLVEYFRQRLEMTLKSDFDFNPTVRLEFVMIALCEMDGTEMGAARLSSF